MIDRDRLRLALDWWDSDFDTQDDGLEIQRIIEAARLVADPDTLILTRKHVGNRTWKEWPEWAVRIVEDMDNIDGGLVLYALLEGQPK